MRVFTRHFLTIAACMTSVPAAAQTVDDQLKAEQLEAAKLANAKTRGAVFDPLAATTAGSTTLTNSEKSVEATLLRYALEQGAAAKLALEVRGLNPAKPSPIIVFGSTPPSVAHWLAFKHQSDNIATNLDKAITRWESVYKIYRLQEADKKAASPRAQLYFAPIAAVASVISMFKTDTQIIGASVPLTNAEFEPIIYAALKQSGFGVAGSLDAFKVDYNGADNAKTLLGDLVGKADKARPLFTDQYLPILTRAEGKPEKIEDQNVAAAGEALRALLEAYQMLSNSLYVETSGITVASMLMKEKELSEKKRSILYITSMDAANSMTVRKSLLTAWSSRPAKVAGVLNLTYVVVDQANDPKGRGSVSCVITERGFNQVLKWGPETSPALWEKQCAQNTVLEKLSEK